MSPRPSHRRPAWVLSLLLLAACGERIPDELNSGLNFVTGTPAFSNYADEVDSWQLGRDEAVRLLGADAVCLPGSSPCQTTDLAQAWIDEVNETLAHGHSEGIALFTLALHLNKRSPSDFGAQSAATLDLSDARVKKEIAYWAATQKIPAALRGDRSFQAKDVMSFLAQALRPDQREAWRLALVMKDHTGFKGGHALVPFGFFRGQEPGQYWLRVYDSNWPTKEQRLFIDTRANTWSYAGSHNADAPRAYRGDTVNGNLLYFSPLTAHEGPFEAPFAQTAQALVVSTNGAGVTLRDEAGAEVGFGTDGTVVEKGGSVRPAFAQSPCVLCPGPAEIVNYTLSPDAGMKGSQTISLSNFGNTSADGGTVNVTGAGVTAKLTGVRTEMSGALLTLSGKSMTYSSSESSTPTSVTLTVAGADGGTITVTVKLDRTPLGSVTIDASDPNDVKVTTTNQVGETVNGSVTVTNRNADGTGKTTTVPIEAKSGKSSAATVNSVTGAASVNPAPGTACDNGRIDLKLSDGGLVGAETDVDCGGLCPACGSGKHCRGAADCSSAVCAATVCQEANCFDRAKNGSETDMDCGGSCWGTCRQGQVCNMSFECATMVNTTGSVCFPDADAGVSRCQGRLRRNLRVTGLGAGASYNLNGTVIDGLRQDDWIVNGATGGNSTVAFDAYRYNFQLGGQRPVPRQGNFTCAVTNPTNDPALLSQGGRGDGGQPLLACTLVASTMTVKSRGCWGMSVPFDATLDGVKRSYLLPINNAPGYSTEGVGSMELGTFRNSARFAAPAFGSRTFDTLGDAGRRQTCPPLSLNSPYNDTTGAFDIDYQCTCDEGDFRGPTATGNPCSGAEDWGPLQNYTFRDRLGDTTTTPVNNFVFPPDAGCGGNANPTRSGSDKVFKVTIPNGLDMIAYVQGVGAPSWKAQLSLITSLTACGTNGATATTTGTSGISCLKSNKSGMKGYSELRHHNGTGANQDVWLVIEGEDFGEAGPYRLSIGAVPHRDTSPGIPCAQIPPLANNARYNQSNPSNVFWANNFVFTPNSTGCASSTTPAMSPIDRQYHLVVPSMKRLSVQLGSSGSNCSVFGNLVVAGSCGTNGANASDDGTTGISCVDSSRPRGNVYCSPRPPLVYENRTSNSQDLWLVVEGSTAGLSDPNFEFEVTTGPLQSAKISTPSGFSFLGSPCYGATRSTLGDEWFGSPYLGPISETIYGNYNNVFLPSSATCAASAQTGSDAVLRYDVPSAHELSVSATAFEQNIGGAVPFVMHAVVGESSCGQNASDFLDAGTTGISCAATTSTSSSSQTLRYTNSSPASQQVYVLFETTRPTLNGSGFTLIARLNAPAVDGGVDAGSADAGQDAGAPDAGPPDAGPPDSGAPDAGSPDAGSPDAGPPDAGPPDAGPPDAGPPDAGPQLCSSDSQCASNNCYCASEPGSCFGLGRCVPGVAVISTSTDGGVSGTFTVPAGCTQVHVSAWGAGGGEAQDMAMLTQTGGAGGHVSGLMSVAPSDVFTVWIGGGGHNGTGITGDEGKGSYFGVPANGGLGDSAASCAGGGGLTSVRQTGSAMRQFTLPAGGGASVVQPGQPAGGTGAGSASTQSGGNAGSGTEGGGGGAGEPGGLGCSTFQTPGDPGAYGTLPSGLTSQNGMLSGDPAQTGVASYQRCPNTTGKGRGGNGCVVLRCTTP